MASEPSNPEGPAASSSSPQDPHGQAALLLVESLIHSLVARSVISVAEAIDIVDGAAEIEAEIAMDRGDPADAQSPTSRLLTLIGDSLSADLPQE